MSRETLETTSRALCCLLGTGLWSAVRVRNKGFRQDFWQNKNMRKIGGLVHGAPKGCYGRVKTFVKWHKAYAIWIMLRNTYMGKTVVLWGFAAYA